ncbi:MAG: 4Fe-4S ferredoxin, partial [Verrucomicrobiae bacterium]
MNWLLAAQRFPPPEFTETGHLLPGLTGSLPRGPWLDHLDVAVLLAALVLAAWLALRDRSRRGLVGLGIFSVLYFGFWRKGCICSIGSIQNIAQGLADS